MEKIEFLYKTKKTKKQARHEKVYNLWTQISTYYMSLIKRAILCMEYYRSGVCLGINIIKSSSIRKSIAIR